MAVISFSTGFLKGHPAYGKQTFFMEKMINWYWDTFDTKHNVFEMIFDLNKDKFSYDFIDKFVDSMASEARSYKSHTVRQGQRWKVGQKFKPVVWSGKPYASKQIQFLPELDILKEWRFQIKKKQIFINSHRVPVDELSLLANNDGLSLYNFMHWVKYPKPFDGQIICWNQHLEYEFK